LDSWRQQVQREHLHGLWVHGSWLDRAVRQACNAVQHTTG
jgi:hypothetical protein